MKLLILVALTIGGLIGGAIGAKLDGGLGVWSLLLGGLVGPILGIWAGYKLGKNWLE